MIRQTRLIFFICFFYLIFFNPALFAQTASNANICAQTQCVKIQNGYLWVLSSDNVTYMPYFVKAVGYQPTPIGRYPSDWGYPATDPRSSNNNIYDDPDILNRDFSLLQAMNANTVRIWQGNNTKVGCACTNNGRDTSYITNAATTANANKTQNMLDMANSYGLKVIAGFGVGPLTFDSNNNVGSSDSNGNLLTAQQIINNFVSYVNTFKGNRAILFWAIGNENNYQAINASPVPKTAFENVFGVTSGDSIFNWLQQAGNFLDFDGDIIVDLSSSAVVNILEAQYPSNYNAILNVLRQYSGQKLTAQQLTAWYGLVDAMARAAHIAEGATFHPVAVVNGGTAEIGNSTDGATDAQMPDLDIWGANVYTGQSFGTLFSSYKSQSAKPFWISEFGVDAWSVTNATGINDWGLTLAADLGGTGSYAPATQSTWDVDLWNEILNNAPVTIGGSVMEYSDEWWKPYEFYCTNAGAGQTNNATSAGTCNSNQKYFGFPNTTSSDDFSNEEWFGVVAISPNSSGLPDIVTPRAVYNTLKTQWQANPWPSITLNMTGSGTGMISSASVFGPGLNCTFASGSSTGNCSAAFTNQPVTLSFSSGSSSIVTNWGVSGCAGGSATCTFTPDAAIILNVTVQATIVPTVTLNSYIYSFTTPAIDFMTATASEAGGTIGRVEFYNGTTLISTVTVAPYEFLWFNLQPGNYSLTAKAYDTNNAVGVSAPVTFTVHGLPTVSLTTSSTTAAAPASVTLTASAGEAYGNISQVQFYNGAVLLGTATASPYTYTWNQVPAGNYTLTAKAFDNSGNGTTSAPVSLAVTAGAPVVGITSPANNASYTLPASIPLTASAVSGSSTISNVTFYNGATVLGTATASPYTYTWSNMAAGTYSLTAVATDNTGKTGTSSAVSITVNPHVAPTVSLTSPANNASYAASSNITLTASASATNATISSVTFYNGAAVLGTATVSPYTYTWSNVPSGTYSLTAVVTDSTGATGASGAVSVTVGTKAVVPAVTLNSYIYSFTAPADDFMTATASETGGTISRVEFYNGTTLISTATVAPYEFLWLNMPAGNYSLTAKAYDTNNAVGVSAPVTFTVNGLPTASLTASNYTVVAPASVTLTAVAGEAYGNISQVQFYNGSVLLGTATASPYTYTWNQVPAGTYSLTAKAFDNSGNVVTSAPVTVAVSAGAPVVSMTSPVNNAVYTLPSAITLTASAVSGNSISKVTFYNGAAVVGTATASPYTYTWSNMAAGTYRLTAVATDNTGATGTSPAVSITVNPHVAPTVSLTSPANNAAYAASSNITLTASASASNATVSAVTFYNGATVLGTATAGPYTYTWSNVPAGTYSLTAVVTDSTGATGSSSAVSVTVGTAASVPVVTLNSYIYSFTAPADDFMTATASEAGGTISRVEFYNGTTLISTATVAPYEFLWLNMPAGNYSLTAKAYDTNNNAGVSAPVTFTVN